MPKSKKITPTVVAAPTPAPITVPTMTDEEFKSLGVDPLMLENLKAPGDPANEAKAALLKNLHAIDVDQKDNGVLKKISDFGRGVESVFGGGKPNVNFQYEQNPNVGPNYASSPAAEKAYMEALNNEGIQQDTKPNYFQRVMKEEKEGLKSAGRNFNPFEMVGNTINAIAPTGPHGEKATDNPNSLLGILKTGIGGTVLGNSSLLNAASRLLGIGPLRGGDGGSSTDLFASSTQAQTPLDSQINQAAANVDRLAKGAALSDIGAKQYAAAQTQLEQLKNQRNLMLSTMQNIGSGTPQQSQEFREAALASGGISHAANNLVDAINDQNPQQLEGTLQELIRQGNIPDQISKIPGAGGLMQAAAQGLLTKYLSDPGNVAVASKIKGMLKAAYKNASVESKKVERIGNQIFNIPRDESGNYDTNSRDFSIAKKIAPTFGEPNYGLPNEESFNQAVDKIGRPYESAGIKQTYDTGVQTGKAQVAQNLGQAAGASKEGKKAVEDLVNATKPPSPAGLSASEQTQLNNLSQMTNRTAKGEQRYQELLKKQQGAK